MCVDEDKCVSGYGYWTVSVGVGPNLSERLSTYLYQRGLGPNVVRNVENVVCVKPSLSEGCLRTSITEDQV